MKVQKIAVADIVMDKPNANDRTFSKEFCGNLAKSIESDGLLHEPIVRPIADNPGKYKVVTGRNRIYACGKVLKWEQVPCKVAPAEMTDDEVKAMEYAENLWRNNLSDSQLKKALIEWRRVYDAKHPAASGKGASAKQAKIVKERIAEAEAKGEKADPEKVADQVAQDNKPFSKVIQETLKVSPATAGRLARVAKNLEPEQIDVLEKHKVTDHITDQLAALGNQELIAFAINLIASGMDHAEAVRQAGKPKREAKARENNGPLTKEQRAVVPPPGKVVAAKPKDKDLTDDEWLAEHCDPILKALKRKGPFKRDAILYRRIFETLARLRTSVKKPLAEAKSADGNGGFFGALARVVRAAHPRHWMVCGGCNGTGTIVAPDKDGKEAKQTCNQCLGAAYKLKMED
jgi:ParB/RepB/Spo0J family partition protein